MDSTASWFAKARNLGVAVLPLVIAEVISITVLISWAGECKAAKISRLVSADFFVSQKDFGSCNQTAMSSTASALTSPLSSVIQTVISSQLSSPETVSGSTPILYP